MEKNISPDDIKHLIKSRDDFLKFITENYCRTCTDPRKKKVEINYDNPINCGCCCEKVKNLLSISSNLDISIKSLADK